MSVKAWPNLSSNERPWKQEAPVNTVSDSDNISSLGASELNQPSGTTRNSERLAWMHRNFLALDESQGSLEKAAVVLVPVPYDGTTSFRSGARDGPASMIEASYGLEDYDFELDLDVSEVGIHTTQMLEPHMGGPEAMKDRVRHAVSVYLGMGKIVGLLGGEHSLTVGSVQAHHEAYPDMSVLYLDAHADLRDEYMGTPWGHASGARRIHQICPLVLAGVRSLSQEENIYISSQNIPFFPWPPPGTEDDYLNAMIDRLGPNVYISVDLDVLDPSLMPSVGTPEPGGMDWHQITKILGGVARSRRVVGFDVCELSPNAGPVSSSYTAAKLVYKLVAHVAATSR